MFCKNLFLHVHLISVRYFFCTTQSENFCDEKVCQDLSGLQNSQPEPQSHGPANLFSAKVKTLTKKDFFTSDKKLLTLGLIISVRVTCKVCTH